MSPHAVRGCRCPVTGEYQLPSRNERAVLDNLQRSLQGLLLLLHRADIEEAHPPIQGASMMAIHCVDTGHN